MPRHRTLFPAKTRPPTLELSGPIIYSRDSRGFTGDHLPPLDERTLRFLILHLQLLCNQLQSKTCISPEDAGDATGKHRKKMRRG